MTAHATQLAGPIRQPGTRRPIPRRNRIRRALIITFAIALAAWSAWGLITSPRLAHAGRAICGSSTQGVEIGRESSCGHAWYDYGFPD